MESAEAPSHVDRVRDRIRERIINGEFPPGTRLRERELAEEFHVSRIPLREAIPQLEAEGFIETTPRRGAVVTTLTVRDAHELFAVRLCVEVHATRLAALNVAAGASTERLDEAMRRCATTHEQAQLALANNELHSEIVRLADNSLLSTMMRTISVRDRWLSRIAADQQPGLACEEHQRLCDAIRSGDGDLSAALAYAHIDRAHRTQLESLTAVLPAPPG